MALLMLLSPAPLRVPLSLSEGTSLMRALQDAISHRRTHVTGDVLWKLLVFRSKQRNGVRWIQSTHLSSLGQQCALVAPGLLQSCPVPLHQM